VEEMLKQLFKEIRTEQQEMKASIGKIETNMATKQDIVNMKLKMTEQFGGLHDAREVQFDVNERICDSLGRIEQSLGRMSLRVDYQGSMNTKTK